MSEDISIITVNQEELFDKTRMKELVLQEIANLLPDNFKKYLQSTDNRKKLLEKYGSKAFLLPEQLKFPVVDPFTGEYHCGLIYAARLRAIQHNYPDVSKQASELYNKSKCSNRINIKIHEHEDVNYSLELIVSLLEVKHEKSK